jgi:hypothetical protein
MIGLSIAGAVVSLLVLAAHFLRGGHPVLTLALLLAPLLLAGRRPWALGTLQVVLALGTLEWLRTLVILAAERLRNGEPLLRMALILAAVAAVSTLSAIGLSRLRGRGPSDSEPRSEASAGS